MRGWVGGEVWGRGQDTKREDGRIEDGKMGGKAEVEDTERNMGARREGAGLWLLQNPLFQKPY